MSEKKGIEETKEVFDFLTMAVEELAAHKADDGKISAIEWAQTVMSTAPAGFKAFSGIEEVDDEVKDLDSAEAKEIAAKGIELGKAVAALLGLGKAK